MHYHFNREIYILFFSYLFNDDLSAFRLSPEPFRNCLAAAKKQQAARGQQKQQDTPHPSHTFFLRSLQLLKQSIDYLYIRI